MNLTRHVVGTGALAMGLGLHLLTLHGHAGAAGVAGGAAFAVVFARDIRERRRPVEAAAAAPVVEQPARGDDWEVAA